MKKINFALVGAGKMGERWAQVIVEHPHAELAAVIDSDFEKAEILARKFPGVAWSNTLQAALAYDIFDAVLVVVPHKYLAPISKEALQAGKHVLCEKPGAIKSKLLFDNLDIAEEKKLVYLIGYNCRYHDAYVKAKKYVENGKIGDVLFVRARYGFGGRPGYGEEWRINKKIGGGGHLLDQGIHMIDMARFFLGGYVDVRGFRSARYWSMDTEDNAFVLMKNQDGAIASIHSSLTQWKRMHNFEVYGTSGYLSIEGLGKRYGPDEHLVWGRRTSDPDVVKEKIIKCDSVADHSLKKELSEFLRCIDSKVSTEDEIVWAAENLHVVEKVYRGDRI